MQLEKCTPYIITPQGDCIDRNLNSRNTEGVVEIPNYTTALGLESSVWAVEGTATYVLVHAVMACIENE